MSSLTRVGETDWAIGCMAAIHDASTVHRNDYYDDVAMNGDGKKKQLPATHIVGTWTDHTSGSVELWSITGNGTEQLISVPVDSDTLAVVAVPTPTGASLLASSHADGTVRVWSSTLSGLVDQTTPHTMPESGLVVPAVVLTVPPNRSELVSIGLDGSVAVVDVVARQHAVYGKEPASAIPFEVVGAHWKSSYELLVVCETGHIYRLDQREDYHPDCIFVPNRAALHATVTCSAYYAPTQTVYVGTDVGLLGWVHLAHADSQLELSSAVTTPRGAIHALMQVPGLPDVVAAACGNATVAVFDFSHGTVVDVVAKDAAGPEELLALAEVPRHLGAVAVASDAGGVYVLALHGE
ncbi:hypothetical protein GGF31_007415 [Allomyces arbusculus]|nr:hypothetical protein GGF31_007415 [Allomyces arbusculus]